MASLIEFQANLKKLNIPKLFEEIMEEQEQEILDLNRDQLLKGRNIKNQKIKPKYKSDQYAKKKAKKNPKPGLGTPDLKLSGDFQDSFFLKKKGKNYLFDAKVPYKQYIIPKYNDVLGLSDKGEKEFKKDIVYKELMVKIRKELGL